MNKIPFKHTRFFVAVAGVVGASMLPNYAAAQGMLEEVIVTAQKRAQSLQDVPISVQAFTGEKLAESGIKDVFDLQTNAPGLTVDQNQNATTSNFSIRGIGTGGNNFGFESAVGLYVDGVYRSRQSSMINQLVDIQSVDILRGPQGTLFGRNTLAGAIQFTTVKPDHENTGFVEVTAGNYDLLNISGAASFSAIDDVLAFRVTGFSSQRDGTFDNIAGDSSGTINDRDRFGFRAQALWTPTDDLSVLVIADYAELDEVCCGFSILYDNNRVDQRTGVLGSSDSVIEDFGGTFVSESRLFDDIQATNFDPESSSEDSGISVQVDWDVQDFTITSITSYREFESFDRIDADFSDLDALTDQNDAEQDQFSQEIRLSFIGEKLNYVFGANYFEQTLNSESTLFFGEDTELIAAFSNGILPDSPLYPIVFGGKFFPSDGFARDFNEQEHESWAVFGQFDYALTETLTFTAGLRYSEEEKELTAVYTDSGDVGHPTGGEYQGFLGAFAATARRDNIPNANEDGKISEDQTTGTVKLSWFMTDDIMLYGSYATGYKAGGTNTDRINIAFDQTFDAETTESYEIGMKAEFPDQGLRLNIAVYSSTIDDQQVGSFNGTDFNVQNAAVAESKGIEIDALWQATDTTTVTMAYSYVDATRDEFEKGNCWDASPFRTGLADPGARVLLEDGSTRAAETQQEAYDAVVCDRSGSRLSINPEDKLIVGVRQEYALSDSMLGYGLFEYSYTGDMELLPSTDPLGLQDSYYTMNLRLGLLLEDYDAEITFWGRNITDEDWVGIAFTAPLQDGKIGAYGREPRTYGVTLNKKF